jgi:hypothetical protein
MDKNADPRSPPWWWVIVNSYIIWFVIGALLFLIFNTSWDPARPGHFSSFGQNQVLILGFITLLLLFKYIAKIKIGPVEIELEKLEQKLIEARQLFTTAQAGIASAQSTDYSKALDKISEAIGVVTSMSTRYS